MAKWKAIYDSQDYGETIIEVCDSRDAAIEACVNYKFGGWSCDKQSERRSGLEQRGWAVIGYSSNTLRIEECD